ASGLASLGRTISAISDCESRTGRGVRLSSSIFFPCFDDLPESVRLVSSNTIPKNIPPFSEFGHLHGASPIGTGPSRIRVIRALPGNDHVHRHTSTGARAPCYRSHPSGGALQEPGLRSAPCPRFALAAPSHTFWR